MSGVSGVKSNVPYLRSCSHDGIISRELSIENVDEGRRFGQRKKVIQKTGVGGTRARAGRALAREWAALRNKRNRQWNCQKRRAGVHSTTTSHRIQKITQIRNMCD